ncbi:Na+/proline symporter [Halogeometricum borinquense DSM 11551]|uniref:Na+/proline symporter n=2 Tax=Halogeometricum borinquense TaxID=60847 RepID=E4NSQ7_HALBP|nr:sodium:solute symporter family protein [Halogeometricum borinquense]ADQ68150.1 Na+/proline symporter [Halogeometricum borinquense DSM 11551]ELY24806.1 Na+/proline symporter [Halogeometricum borinquense DSM 11551]RYJ12949.1 sodium:solute symporter family protein [Halogeometricum borinquense]
MPVQPDGTLLYPVVGYLLLMGVIAAWSYGNTDSVDDFMLAGRGLGTVIIAGTLLATWMGSGSITGSTNSLAYSYGLWPAVLSGTSALVGIGVLWFLSSRIRGYDKYTIPEILGDGIGKEAKAIGLVTIAAAYVGIVSYQFTGFGFVLNVTTGIPVETGTLIGAALIIILATTGGLMSVAYTDAISALLMAVGLIVGLPFILSSAGGVETVTSNVSSSPFGSLTGLQFLGYWAPALLLILADQNMYQRIVAGGSNEETDHGIGIWFIGVAVTSTIIPVIAFAARSLFPDIEPGMAMIAMTTVIPTWIGGILLAAAAAFVITTGTSYLLSASTNISQDLYRGFINPNASDKQVFWMTRVTVVVLGAFAFVLGQYFPTILSLQMLAYTAYGATITPALFAVFLMRGHLTKLGGVSGMVAGFSATIIWSRVLAKPFDLNAVIVSAPIAAIVIIAVSLVTGSTQSQAVTSGQD